MREVNEFKCWDRALLYEITNWGWILVWWWAFNEELLDIFRKLFRLLKRCLWGLVLFTASSLFQKKNFWHGWASYSVCPYALRFYLQVSISSASKFLYVGSDHTSTNVTNSIITLQLSAPSLSEVQMMGQTSTNDNNRGFEFDFCLLDCNSNNMWVLVWFELYCLSNTTSFNFSNEVRILLKKQKIKVGWLSGKF